MAQGLAVWHPTRKTKKSFVLYNYVVYPAHITVK